MFYSPKPDKKGAVTAVSLILLSAVVSAMSRTVPQAGGIFNVAAALVITAALFITIRFVISGYVYEITSDSLVVTKITGQRKTTVASLSLSEGVGVAAKPKTAEERAVFLAHFGKTDARMNFCRNLFAKSYVFVSYFNGKKYEILFETDEEFAKYLENAVIAARNLRDDENE